MIGVNVAALRCDLATVMEALTRLGPERIRAFDAGLFGKVVIKEK